MKRFACILLILIQLFTGTAQAATMVPASYIIGISRDMSSRTLHSKGVTISKKSAKLKKGETIILTANVTPASASQEVTWSSSKSNVAAVRNDGTITAYAKGTATITAKAANGKKATCKITVVVPVTGITLGQTSIVLAKKKKMNVKASVIPSDASDKKIHYSSSSKNVATVSSEGVVTAMKNGTAIITAKTKDGGFIQTCAVTVGKQAIDKELTKYIGTNIHDLAKMFGDMKNVGATDGVEYKNSYLIISAPWRQTNIEFISLKKQCIFTILGLHVGMRDTEAYQALETKGWTFVRRSPTYSVLINASGNAVSLYMTGGKINEICYFANGGGFA